MIYRAEMAATIRRLRVASGELSEAEAAAKASARMAYLYAWSVRQGGVLDREDLEVAIWSYLVEYPDGLRRKGRGAPGTEPPNTHPWQGDIDR